MSEWQSIETAPKDGTHILAWCDIGCKIVHWIDGDGWSDGEVFLAAFDCIPTHWMLLPAPPK